MTIYTIGYQNKVHNAQHLKRIAEHLQAVVVDTRFSPFSRNPEWRSGWLKQVLGERYIGERALGNKNYQNGGPIELADPEAAWERLEPVMWEQDIILMCACRDQHSCHRTQAAAYLAERSGQRIIHLAPDYPGDVNQPALPFHW